jgi:hypothetical protein
MFYLAEACSVVMSEINSSLSSAPEMEAAGATEMLPRMYMSAE